MRERNTISLTIYILKMMYHEEKYIIWNFQKRLRKTELYYNQNKRLRYMFCRRKLNILQNKYGMFIPPNTCGKGLVLPHIGKILINGYAKIGEDCVIHINVAIAVGGRCIRTEVPIVGNNCIIGVGSTLIGKITIGDNTFIGANSLVNKNFIEGNCVIGGNPARIISNNSPLKFKMNKI